VDRGVERLARHDGREQREDVFEIPRGVFRQFALLRRVLDLGSIEQPIALPDLRRHRQLTLDHGNHPRPIDG